MADTLIVLASPTGYEPPGYGGGYFPPSLSGRHPAASGTGPRAIQGAISFFNSSAMCANTLSWLADYVKKHGASDPLTIQVVTNNIRYFLNADRNLCLNPHISVFDAYMSTKSPAARYNYRSMSMKQMSGKNVTVLAAFGHYLWGNGEARYVNLQDVGLNITPQQIPELMKIISSGVTGNIPIDIRFNHNTFDSGGVIPAAYLGNVSLQTKGTLSIKQGGAWSYNGVVRA
ncbi:lipid II-degrading bacteriocin [Escherichia coli]|nr:lipid II-degrading bacteriocin [Escherichia coli]MDM4884921.1 lipid II-degrading bacteriocin [Escherichia coli]